MTSNSDTESDSGLSADDPDNEAALYIFEARSSNDNHISAHHSTSDVIQAIEALQSAKVEDSENVRSALFALS